MGLDMRYTVPLPILTRFLEAAHNGHLNEYSIRAKRRRGSESSE